MGRPVRKIKGYSSDQIKALFGQEEKYKIGLRLYAVYQVSLGKPSRQLEELYNTSSKQILNWVSRFESEGIEGLKDKEGRGRKERLSIEQKEELKTLLLDQSPQTYGYNTDTWTGPILREWLIKQWQIEYKKTQIYSVIKSLGLTYQKSRGFYPEADSSKQEVFKNDLKKTPREPR